MGLIVAAGASGNAGAAGAGATQRMDAVAAEAPSNADAETVGTAAAPGTAVTADSDYADADADYAEGVVDISLGETSVVSGAGATVEGDVVTITAAGVYRVSGTLNGGALVVDAKGKVYLEFKGVNVTSGSGPALLVRDAKKVVITLVEGTENRLADMPGWSDDTAALYTNDTLLVNGKGTLAVEGNNNEAISSDDDIIINSGTLVVTAVDDGLNAHDDITINGGRLTVTAGGDGLDSNGTIHINGGTLVAFGGPRREKAASMLWAPSSSPGGRGGGGNTVAAVSPESKQGTVCVTGASVQPEGTALLLSRDGEEIFSFTPEAAYRTLFVSSPDLVMGAEYQAYIGGGEGTVVVATR
jgi:hypothetical protein